MTKKKLKIKNKHVTCRKNEA